MGFQGLLALFGLRGDIRPRPESLAGYETGRVGVTLSVLVEERSQVGIEGCYAAPGFFGPLTILVSGQLVGSKPLIVPNISSGLHRPTY